MAKNVLADKANSPSNSDKARSALKVIKSVRTVEGGGFIVNRAFPTPSFQSLIPFCYLMKWILPTMVQDTPRRLQTIRTEALKPRHICWKVNSNTEIRMVIKASSVQVMSSGWLLCLWRNTFWNAGGRIHSNGVRMHGLQLWINLPKRDKMINPHYQDIPSSIISVAKTQMAK